MCCCGESNTSLDSKFDGPPTPDDCEEISLEQLLDEEYDCFMRVGYSLLDSLKSDKDVEIAQKMLDHCEFLHANPDLMVRTKTNIYLKFFLKILSWSVDFPAPPYFEMHSAKKTEKKQWLVPDVWYMGVKKLGCKRLLVYLAKADCKDTEWIDGGFSLRFKP